MIDEVNWYYVVSPDDGNLGYVQMSANEVEKLKEYVIDNFSRSDPPDDLTGWRTIIVPESVFYKMSGLDGENN